MGELTDRELADMLRAAGNEAPPPGFDVADVVAASKRATARRRSAIAGGAAAVLLVAGGVTAAIAIPGSGSGGETTSAASAPEAATGGGRGDAAVAPAAPAPSDTGGGCADLQDAGLRALLDEALPQVRGATEAATSMVCKPGGGREVHLQVTDGPLHGLLSVVFTPPGEPVEDGEPAGWARAGAPTASGGYVAVTSTADADSGGIPFEADLATTAAALAPRL
jgi:hypothetical protein